MRRSDAPPVVDTRREEVRERLATAPGVLLALDFDGTLAPIVDEPGKAAMAADCRSVLDDLRFRDDIVVAVVSGRELADVRTRVGFDDVRYAGNHGLELRRGDRAEVHPDAAAEADAIDDLCADIADKVAHVDGSRVENKGVTATVHYREVDDDEVDAVVEAVEAVVASADADLEVLEGKQIREIRPDVDWDKGQAVNELQRDVPRDWLSVYVGDDETDEDAIALVEPDGMGVRVGDAMDTAASYRIPDQDGVAEFLELVARARAE